MLDADGHALWVSGRTDPHRRAGRPGRQAVAGEFMWKSECRPKTAAEQTFQPHYQTITRQDQAQIYQELVRDPRGKLTTSFLSLADVVKDNRLLPRGWTPSVDWPEEGLGSPKLSAEALVHHVLPDLPDGQGGEVHDPWYKPKSKGGLGGGGDALTYAIPLADLQGDAGQRAGDPLLSGHPALLSSGPLLHHAHPAGHRAPVLRGRPYRPHRHPGRGVEAAGGVERGGGGGWPPGHQCPGYAGNEKPAEAGSEVGRTLLRAGFSRLFFWIVARALMPGRSIYSPAS